MLRRLAILLPVGLLLGLPGCKTKSDLRREADVEQLKQEVKNVRSDRADIDTLAEELKVEVSKMNNLIEERTVQQNRAIDDLRREVQALTGKVQSLENKVQQAEQIEHEREKAPPPAPKPAEKPKPTLDLGKRYYDDGKYDEAIEVLKTVKSNKKTEESKKASFLLGESYFASREFASAALEFSEFKKNYPRDTQVPLAIYRQANAFKSLKQNKEAKLFYQELVDKFPKSPLATKAKKEMKSLK